MNKSFGGSNLKKNITIITALVCAAACVVSVMVLARKVNNNDDSDVLMDTTAVTDSITTDSETTSTPETLPPYISPKDFTELKKLYPHIHGWLQIENSYIDYPVVQHPTDDTFYYRKSAEGENDERGCIMTEHIYNRTDFEDPVTVLYGHYVGTTGKFEFFGGLQEMYSAENYKTYENITVYHKDKELKYQFYCAVKYDTQHIPWNYDFSDPESYNKFLDRVASMTGPDMVQNPDVTVTPDDQLIIFSTCYNGGYGANKNVRYIVIAKLVDKVTEN